MTQKENELYILLADGDLLKYAFSHPGKNFYLITVNPKFYRPADVEILLGDSTLARKELNWKPKYSFRDLVKEMVESDIKHHHG